MLQTQPFLRESIVELLDGELNNEMSLEDINKWVWFYHKDELKSLGIEWTYQHLIASTRKHLVDVGVLKREKNNGTTFYTLRDEFVST